MNKALNLAALLFVPAFGTIAFNLLTHVVEKGPTAPIPPSVYDFSFGCALVIVGIAAAVKERDSMLVLFVSFVILLIVLLVVDVVIANLVSHDQKIQIIMLANIIALLVVASAIWKTT